ncbi:hypothetical protein [Streptomyces mangrovisoli]|uniref:hypothetical protein n=1 Tax=Streptomyces mangrovisoli TaxID=1428628 RepID=UPI001160B2FB|nr:hypothetical protein [Streptomyces mangrovisoli]
MDAGVAAVLGAVTGSISGVIGSITAGRAQREGVRMTVRSEHAKERHQPRRDAYKAFLQVLLDLEARLTMDAYEDSTPEEEKQLRSELDARWIDVVLAGPEAVTVVGYVVRNAVDDVFAHMAECRQLMQRAIEDYADEDEEEAARQEYEDSLNRLHEFTQLLVDSVNAFGTVASKILDRDGTELQKRSRWWRLRNRASSNPARASGQSS